MKIICESILLVLALLIVPLSFASVSYDFSSSEFENTSVFTLNNYQLNKIYINLENVSNNWDYNILFLDLPQTSGFDYVITKDNDYLMVENIGSLQGVVIDNLGNIIPNAKLSFDCLGGYNYNNVTQADDFGSFTAHLPLGSCRVITKHQDRVGIVDINTKKGDLQRIEMSLNLTQKSDANLIPRSTANKWYVILSVIILVILSISLRRKATIKTLRQENKKEIKKEDNIKKSLFDTLNYREQEIVKSLQEKGTLNQSDLKEITGLPKSTLSRILKKMFLKNIIDIKECGNIKKISINSNFK